MNRPPTLTMAFSLVFFVLAALPIAGQAPKADDVPYRITFDAAKDVEMSDRDEKGKKALFITVKFAITFDPSRQRKNDNATYKLVIEEDGNFVKEEDVPVPDPSEDLSVVLALDTSGSMREGKRMDQARVAAATFLDKLPKKADCGLILFDHEIRPPTLLPDQNRAPLLKEIQTVQPRGGTAYLDAAVKGIDMLRSFKHGKALVIITDGIDLNSQAVPADVIAQAKKNKVRIYTIGIGEAGKLEPVTSALVLDHSGSMKPPADSKDTVSKMEALHRAATRFVTIMPATGRTTLVPFSTGVGTPEPFTNQKFRLIKMIKDLTPYGETALFDGVFAGLATLEAENPKGKRVVIAMTDGIDNSSRRRVDEVIDRAKDAKIPLYLLGFGRPGEIDAITMKKMAKESGGYYFHAGNEKDLLELFEDLSIKIHDDGIDEVTLKKLAGDTSGAYFHAKNVADLKLILQQVTENIQKKAYSVTFPSLRQVADGKQRHVALKLVRAGQVVSTEVGRVQTHGVVIAEMSYLVYLIFLAGIGLLLALPSMFKRASTAS